MRADFEAQQELREAGVQLSKWRLVEDEVVADHEEESEFYSEWTEKPLGHTEQGSGLISLILLKDRSVHAREMKQKEQVQKTRDQLRERGH